MTTYTAVKEKGMLVVRCAMTWNDKPKMGIAYWHTNILWETAEWYGITEGAALSHPSNGTFYWYSNLRSLRIDLPEGGQTKAFRQEEVDVERPKARGKELRWRNGRWQKLLKRGWVNC